MVQSLQRAGKGGERLGKNGSKLNGAGARRMKELAVERVSFLLSWSRLFLYSAELEAKIDGGSFCGAWNGDRRRAEELHGKQNVQAGKILRQDFEQPGGRQLS
jgi:hypothetical protein